jgi:DNA-binding transcriptional ArsR family regulator
LDEEKRKEILEKRKTHRKLSKMILQGKDYSESAEVKGIDGETYDVLIRPLGEGEIIAAYREGGISFSEVADEKEARKKLEDIILVQHNIIAKGSQGANGEVWTAEEVGKLIRFGESFPLARRILELSGIFGKEPESLKTFRTEQVQPTG